MTTLVFRQTSQDYGQFFRDLPLHEGALEFYYAIEHLHPISLTGGLKDNWSQSQKVAWAAHHFPGVEIITCRSRDKRFRLRQPGDVLVEGFLKYRNLWADSGGVFIHHTSPSNSLEESARLGFEICAQVPGQ